MVLKNVINKNVSEISSHNSFTYRGSKVTNSDQIANIFNEYFVNVGPSLAKNIDIVNKDPVNYLSRNYPASMFLRETDENEIVNVIMKQKSNKACGYDDISIDVVKYTADILCKPLSFIFNSSLVKGIFPDSLKIAKVIPIYKGGEKDFFLNYRPISVLCIFSKLLETVFYDRLVNYINFNNILTESQYGFRNKRSTNYALIDLVEEVRHTLDENKTTAGVFLDLRKAFDTINHDILMKKLHFYGVRGVPYQWISSYLKNRMQFVTYNQTYSTTLPTTCGVPQGSILGPLLFIIYINDICNTSQLLKFVMFADDTNVFVSHKSIKHIEKILNSELQNLVTWFKANKVSLNIEKTNFILFQRKAEMFPTKNIDLYMDNFKINQIQYAKFLGVTVDSKLTWKNHIAEIESKISKNIGVISRASKFLKTKELQTLYCSLILPYLYCGVVLWGNNYQSNLNRIIKLQKRVIRITAKADHKHSTLPLFHNMGLLKFTDIVFKDTAIMMYEVANSQVPMRFTSMFKNFTSVHDHKTRQYNDFYFPKFKTNIKKFSFSVVGCKIWNSLSNELKSCKSLDTFKRNIKKYLLKFYQTKD